MLNKLCALHTERLNSSDRGTGKFKRTTITRSHQPIHQQAASSSRLTRETPESRPSSISSTTKPQALAPGRSQPETVYARSEVSPMKATNNVDHEYMRRHATFPPHLAAMSTMPSDSRSSDLFGVQRSEDGRVHSQHLVDVRQQDVVSTTQY